MRCGSIPEVKWDYHCKCKECGRGTKIFNMWFPTRVCIKCQPVVHSVIDMEEDRIEELIALSELGSRYV